MGEVFPKQKGIKEGEEQYEECLSYREIWDDLSNINEDDVRTIVIPFLNKWKCRLPYECAPKLTVALQEVEPLLKPLRRYDIGRVNLLMPIGIEDGTLRKLVLIEKVFNRIYSVKAGRRTVGFTAISKILHMAVPRFFVMSDEKIREAYGCGDNEKGYANFMFRMNLLASDLISQANGEKEKILNCSKWKGRTLARLLDNFNYTVFTLRKTKCK
ncbi:MAG: hypothetical protein QW491_10305 [Thermoproteota archaeon]